MKLVLFGATGNVGQRVAAEALRRGHEVIGVVRNPAVVESPDPRVRLVKGDATNAESVADVARGAEAVVSAISPPILTENLEVSLHTPEETLASIEAIGSATERTSRRNGWRT